MRRELRWSIRIYCQWEESWGGPSEMCCQWEVSWGGPSEFAVNENRVEVDHQNVLSMRREFEVDHQNVLSMRRELRWTIRMCCQWEKSWGGPSEVPVNEKRVQVEHQNVAVNEKRVEVDYHNVAVNEKRVEVDHQKLLSMRRELRGTIRMCCQWEDSWGGPSEYAVNEKRVEVDHQNVL